MGSGGTIAAQTQYSYDNMGRVECTAVRMNPAAFGALPASACTLGPEGSHGPDRITKTVYDLAGQVVQVFRAWGTPLQQADATYGYSLNGKRTAIIDANGNKATMTFDGHDRLARWSLPSKTTPGAVSATDFEAYEYDANGNRTKLKKRDGRELTYSYDALNRMTVKTVPDGSGLAAWATRDVYYRYDLRGLQTDARFDSPTGEGLAFSYDGFGRKTTETSNMGGVTRTLTSAYDGNGARIGVTHPDGPTFNTYRDGLGRLGSIYRGGVEPLVYPNYDNQGRLAISYRLMSFQLGGGSWGMPSSYGYDPAGRLASLAHAPGGGAVTTTFSHNPAGQITSLSRSNDGYAWNGYVTVNRAYAANGLNQYTTAGPASFTYDANGNLTADGTNSYSYDVENRLVSASNGAQLSYDPLGRLWEVTKSGATTRLVYDGDQLTAEYDAAGTLLRRYVHGDGADDPQVWYEGAGTTSPRYLYADHLGSIVAIADAAGNVTNINSYDEYGIPKATNAGRFQYTGQAWLAELGMYYYKARMYSPTAGRFMQTDPIGYDDGPNIYAYVGNDPVNGRDPTGMLQCSNDKRCDTVHAAAAAARTGLNSASTEFSKLAGALKSGEKLSVGQTSLVSAFEKKFGSGSATVGNLEKAVQRLDSVASKIGEQGQGAKVNFAGPSPSALATARVGGNKINIHDGFFSKTASTQAFVIGHEGGHLVGLRDRAMVGAPLGVGLPSLDAIRAYGQKATDWLGANSPKDARRNTDSYMCLALACYP